MPKQASTRLGFIPTMQPMAAESAPDGDEWLHEIKYDGYRTELLLQGSQSKAYTRNGHDWSEKYSRVLKAAKRLSSGPTLFDGEIICQNDAGLSDFHALRSTITAAPDRLVFYAFDLLVLNGRDIRTEPLIHRRERLREIVGEHDPSRPVQFSEHIVGNGPAFFHQAEQLGLEGIVSKLLTSRYRSGYSSSWYKIKAFEIDQYLVVGTEAGIGPTTALCARESPQGLVYAGSAILSLKHTERSRFWEEAERLIRPTPPLPLKKRKTARWLEPKIRVRVRHLRGEEKLRHASIVELL